MATPKNVLTLELAEKLHRAAGFMVAGAVCSLPLILVSFSHGPLVGLASAAAGVCMLVGLKRVREATGAMVESLGGSRVRKTTYAEHGAEYAPQPPAAVYEAPPITAPRHARVAVEPPAAVYARSAPATKKKPVAAESAAPVIEWEEWVGQKLLQKVGIVIVLIGMLVFLQQAFENRWIDELGRVFLSFVTSAALLGAGEWFQRKYPQWSHGFTGGGLALAYLGVWVAHVLYADALASNYGFVIPASVAFTLYGAITAVGVLLSIRYDARTVAWFALAGGYLTPLLVDASAPNPYVFSAYLAVLSAGLLALSANRPWKGMAIAAFLPTQFYLLQIYNLSSLPNAAQAIIAIGFFAIFAALPLVRHFLRKEQSTREDVFLIVGNAAAVFLAVQDALGGWRNEWVTLLCLALAGFTVACAALALRTRREDPALGDTYLLGSIVLIALALLRQLEWEWLALGWAPYAAVVMHLAVALKRRSAWIASNLLFAGAAAALLTQLPVFVETEGSWRPFLSNWSLQSYAVFASLLAMLPAARKAGPDMTGGPGIEPVLHGCIALVAFAVLTFEVTSLRWVATAPLALSYLAYAGVAAFVFLATRQLVWFAAAFLAQALVFLFAFVSADGSDLRVLHLLDGVPRDAALPVVHPWGFVSILSIALVVGLLAVAMRGAEHPMLPRIQTRNLLLGMIVAQVWLHVSVEIQHVAAALDFTNLDYTRALSAWWIIAGLAVSRVAWTPQWRKAAVLLLALPFAKDMLRIMGGDATLFDTIAWTLIALGVAAYGAHAKRNEMLTAGITALAGTAAADMLSNIAMATTGTLRSVWWAITGLLAMMAGFALRTKVLRQASLGIFAATVVKLLLFDFSALGTPIRIAASIGTGLLLIGASYLYQRYGTPKDER